MLFKRRTPEPLLSKIHNKIWPRMGWARFGRYLKLRTLRIPDSAHSIAAGLALGVAVSWTPTLGLHLLQVAFFCWLLRGNFFAGVIGSLVGNPWTFPLFFWMAYHVGKTILWTLGFGDVFYDLPGPLSLEEMMDQKLRILLPMLLGGYVCAGITFPTAYYFFRGMIKAARAARKLRITRQAHRAAKEVTEE